jgi:hypothetical protein
MKKTILYTLFGGFLIYWGALNLLNIDPESSVTSFFSSSYIVIALLGGLFGFAQAKYWGGFKSLLGKSLSFLSLGLILTTLGSLTLSFYFYVLDQEPSYPSVAEVFYLPGIVSYIIGVTYMARTVRSWASLKEKGLGKKILLVLTPLAMVALTTFIFVSKYGQGEGAPTSVIVTDYAYALLQAAYAFVAIAVLLNSSQLFGGKLRKAVTVLLVALIFQYLADFNYTYQILSETWQTGGYGELLYLIAYALVGISIQLFVIRTPEAVETPETVEAKE